jgi:hypothetical protein
MFSATQNPHPQARWQPEYDQDFSEQLALTLMESLSRELGAPNPSLSSSRELPANCPGDQPTVNSVNSPSLSSSVTLAASSQQGYRKSSETSDLWLEPPPKQIEAHVMEVGHMLDRLESQKTELYHWLSTAFHSPAERAPPVMPAPFAERSPTVLPSHYPQVSQSQAPELSERLHSHSAHSLLARKLSLGSSLCGDSQSWDCDRNLAPKDLGPHRGDLNRRPLPQELTYHEEQSLFYFQQHQSRQFGGKVQEPIFSKAPAAPVEQSFSGSAVSAPISYATTPSTRSPTMTPKSYESSPESFQSLSGSDDNIPTDQFFVHPAHSKAHTGGVIAPPPGLEHLVPQSMPSQDEAIKSTAAAGKSRRKNRGKTNNVPSAQTTRPGHVRLSM